MINITHKSKTHRIATAQAIVKVGSEATITAIKNKNVPKGDVLESSRVSGLFAIKKTSEMIPDCHPLPIESASLQFRIEDLSIIIEAEVQTIYRTGVEVEAMHGVSVAALTIYDMLKPIDKEIEITSIKLLKKKGGKSDQKGIAGLSIKAAVVVCSDSVSAGLKEDGAGKALINKLKSWNIDTQDYSIIPDDIPTIQQKLTQFAQANFDLVLFTGGTGVSARDQTPEALRPLFDKELIGISETIRQYGQERTPYSMLSRGVAGLIGNMLILALPGSTKGATESIDAVFPAVLHVFQVLKNEPHEK